MPHIKLPDGVPGIHGPMMLRPEMVPPMRDLAAVLMTGPHTLSAGERELIAAHVSGLNECAYCQRAHSAIAAHHLGSDIERIAVTEKLKALLAIAGAVQLGGKKVTTEDIAQARRHGASDLEIHDTVLIAAFFCLCNRYVDGLDAWTPDDPEFYRQRAAIVATNGYAASAV
jgi:uncharacterized peroxidase-related enzyme